jgi:hypothetical protein
MSDGRTNTKKRAVSARAVSARITQHNTMSTRKSTRTTTTRTAAAALKAALAEVANLKAALAAATAAAPAVAAAPAPAPAAPVAPAPAPAVAKAKAPAVPADIQALVGKTVVIRYEAASYPGRPLTYTCRVDTAWAAKGGFFIKGPVAERDGAERWFRISQVREWISRG